MNTTYFARFNAHAFQVIDGVKLQSTVTLPDEVAGCQGDFDGREILVCDHHGEEVSAILRGDLYGPGTPDQGDPIVEIL